MLTALALTLCTQAFVDDSTHGAHLIRVELLTQDQIQDAPVDVLTRVQLRAEDQRLTDNMPTLIMPSVLLGVGGGLAITFGIFTGLLINAANHSTSWDNLGDVLLAILTGIVTTGGGVLCIVGGAILPARVVQRDHFVARQQAVHARLDDLTTGRAQEPLPLNPGQSPSAQRNLFALEDKKPGLGLPIGLMSGGAGAAVFGGYIWAINGGSFSSNASRFAIPIALFALGFIAEGFGVWQLISRLQERAEIDAQIRDIQDMANDPNAQQPPPPPPDESPVAPPAPPPPPPPGADRRLPATPMQFSYAWRF